MTGPRTRKPPSDPRLDLYILSQQRLEKELASDRDLAATRHDQILKALGFEDMDEKGSPVGKGLTGRVMRLEVWRKTIDGWMRYSAGALASAVLFLGAIWWLAGDQVSKVLKH